MVFSDMLRKKLEEKNMTKAELARQIDVADTTVCRYVKGTISPRPLILKRIAKVLDISIYEMYRYL